MLSESNRPASPPRVGGLVSREAGCQLVTSQRKYYDFGDVFMKRTLRPHEFYVRQFDTPLGPAGSLVLPFQPTARLCNEAACLQFIKANTDIPVPRVIAEFEDDKAIYLLTEKVKGVTMTDLNEQQRKVVEAELEHHLGTLQALKSTKVGGPTGLIITPDRIQLRTPKEPEWQLRDCLTADFVFTHGDLRQDNVIVDQETLKINGIIDWEYGGFFPKFIERRWYLRDGPAGAVAEETGDCQQILDFFTNWSINVPGDAEADLATLQAEPLPIYRVTQRDHYNMQLAKKSAVESTAESTANNPVVVDKGSETVTAVAERIDHQGDVSPRTAEPVCNQVTDTSASTHDEALIGSTATGDQ